jgi:hypothetical protein
MEGKKEATAKYTLILNEEERNWLRGMVQNPLINEESEKDRIMRQYIWNSLE